MNFLKVLAIFQKLQSLKALELVEQLQAAVKAQDWKKVALVAGDILKVVAEFLPEGEPLPMKADGTLDPDGVLTEEELKKLDPATIALIFALVKMGLTWLVERIKKRWNL